MPSIDKKEKIINNKHFYRVLEISAVFVGVIMTLYYFYPAFASPPATMYAPGETTDPTCSPGDTNCSVYPPLTTTLTTSTAITMGTSSLRFAYNSTNYSSFTVSSDGGLTIASTNNATTTFSNKIFALANAYFGTIASGTWNGTNIGLAYGGTNSTTISANGSIIYSDGAGYNSSAVGTLGDVLMSTGGGKPVWVNSTTIGGSGTVNSGTAGQFAYYASSGATLTATSSIFLALNRNVGIGTTTPAYKLSVSGTTYTSDLITKGPMVDVRAYGATNDASSDSTAAFQAAINAAYLNLGNAVGGVVYVPAGIYLITGTLTISNSRIHILGAGKNATVISFQPASGGLPAFHFTAGASVLYQNSISNLSINGSGSLQKIGIQLSDTSEMVVEDISMLYMNGNSSVGIQLNGREVTTLNRISINADKPLVIGNNPNSTIDVDHLHVQDAYFVASGTNPNVTIDSGVNLTNVTFDGYQAWALGGYGLRWVDTTTAAASANLSLDNIRWEQSTYASGYIIDIEHNYTLQNLSMKNIYGGSNTNGIKLRNVDWASIDHYMYVDAAKTALDVNTTVLPLTLKTVFFQAGSTSTFGGLTTVMDSGRDTLGGTTIPLAVYDVPSATGVSSFNRLTIGTTTLNGNPFSVVSSSAIGSSMLTVLTNGRVGINSSSPIASLALQGTGGTNPFAINSSTGASLLSVLQNGNVGIGTATAGKLLELYENDGTAPELKINNGYATHSQGVSNTGYIRFTGLVAPGGNNNVEDKFLMGLRSGALNSAWDFVVRDTVASADRLVINQNGDMSIGTSTSITATLTLQGRSSINPFVINSSTGAAMLNVLTNGNVGIGVTTPATKLQILSANSGITNDLMFSNDASGNYRNGISNTQGVVPLSNVMIFNLGNGTVSGQNRVMSIFGNTTVSIGSSTSFASLGIQGVTSSNPFSVNSSTGASMLAVLRDGSVGINSSTPIASFALQGTGGTNPFSINSSTGASLLAILQNGSVGIGTNTPSALLDINNLNLVTKGLNISMPSITTLSQSSTLTVFFSGDTSLAKGATGLFIDRSVTGNANGIIFMSTSTPLWSTSLDMTTNDLVFSYDMLNEKDTFRESQGGKFFIGNDVGSPLTAGAQVTVFTSSSNVLRALDVYGSLRVLSTPGFANVFDINTVSSTITLTSEVDDASGLIIGSPNATQIDGLYLSKSGDTARNWLTWHQGSGVADWRVGMQQYDFGIFNAAGQSTNASSPGRAYLTILQSNGNLGIGTTTPIAVLSVLASSTNAGNLIFEVASSSGASLFRILANGNVGINSSSPIANFALQGIAGTNPFSINSSTGASLLSVLQNGNVGINSSTPIDTLGVQGGFQVVGGVTSTNLYVSSLANIIKLGINTSSPIATFALQGIAGTNPFSINSSTGASLLTILQNGNVGINTTTPPALLSVAGTGITSTTKSFGVYNASSSLVLGTEDDGSMIVNDGAIYHDGTGAVTFINSLETGNLYFPDDAGAVTWTNLNASSSAAGTIQSYTAAIGDNPVLTVYGESDGSAGIKATSTMLGIGTTTPQYFVDVLAASTLQNMFRVGNTTTANALIINSAGSVGINTTSPIASFALQGVGSANPFSINSSTGSSLFRVLTTGAVDIGAGNWLTFGGANTLYSLAGVGLLIQQPDASTKTFFRNSVGGVQMAIDASGNVGVNSSTPIATLGVQGVATANPFSVNSTTGSAMLNVLSNGNVGIGLNVPTVALQLHSTAATTLELTDDGTGSTANDGLLFQISSGAGGAFLWNRENGFLSIGTNNAEKMRLTAGGLLGIGTTTPVAKLEVWGAGNTSTTVAFNTFSASGTSTFKIDNAGNAFFANDGLYYEASSSVSYVNSLETGPLNFDDNAGLVSWVDMVVSSSVAGMPNSYTASINGNPMIQVYADSDGLGGVANMTVSIATSTTSTYKMYIDAGVSTTAGLGVNGFIKASGYIAGTTTLDIAETYPVDPECETNGNCPQVGDVVCSAEDTSSTFFIEQCAATSTDKIIGVVSGNPGFILGGYDVKDVRIKGLYPTSFRPIALSGRVPVNVSTVNGAIKAGDYLTSSAVPGVAVKALEPGKAIGMALQSFDGSVTPTGTVTVFVNTSWAPGSPVVLTEAEESIMPDFAQIVLDKFTLTVKNSLRKLGLLIKDGIATVKEVFADKVTTQQLCVGSTCINEQQLQDLLNKTQTQAAAANALTTGGNNILDLQSPVVPTTTLDSVEPTPDANVSSTVPVVVDNTTTSTNSTSSDTTTTTP